MTATDGAGAPTATDPSAPRRVSRLGLVVHRGRPEAVAVGRAAAAWAREHDIAVTELDVWADPSTPPAFAGGPADLLVTAGGDGTFLRGVRAAAGAPVLGVAVGRVGFLTEITPEALVPALDAVLAGTARIEERMTLGMRASRALEIPPELQAVLTYGRGPSPEPARPRPASTSSVGVDTIAVNDVVLEKLTRDRQASLAVYLDRRRFTSYSADALVISSPTGSTAYSFAAGGPVVAPTVDALVFTPVAPHMVFDRSLVVAPRPPVAVRVLEHSTPVAVTVDGQLTGVLGPGDWIAVDGDPPPARLVRLGPDNFFGRVRTKFSLADAAAAVADADTPPEALLRRRARRHAHHHAEPDPQPPR